jgi:hypothetical protein
MKVFQDADFANGLFAALAHSLYGCPGVAQVKVSVTVQVLLPKTQ